MTKIKFSKNDLERFNSFATDFFNSHNASGIIVSCFEAVPHNLMVNTPDGITGVEDAIQDMLIDKDWKLYHMLLKIQKKLMHLPSGHYLEVDPTSLRWEEFKVIPSKLNPLTHILRFELSGLKASKPITEFDARKLLAARDSMPRYSWFKLIADNLNLNVSSYELEKARITILPVESWKKIKK